MAIVTSEKVFIDPKEEVTTILERLFKSDKPRVILVIPQNSLLLSSYVTINILFREIARSPKLAVLVTEDDYGASISRKAGFEVVSKVSLVTSDEWDKALSAKKQLLQILEERKQTLLGNFQGDQPMEDNIPEFQTTVSETESMDQGPLAVSQPAEDELPEPQFVSDLVQNVPEAAAISPAVVAPAFSQMSSIEEEEAAIVKKFTKPRREPKVVKVGGIEIMSGGDIQSLEKPVVYDKMEGPINSDENIMEAEVGSQNNLNEIPARRNISPSAMRSRFTGKDFTKSVGKKVSIGGFFSFGGNKSEASGMRGDNVLNKTNKKRRKILIGAFIAILFLFLTGGYVLAFQSSSVEINLELKKEDVSTSASIIVDPELEEMIANPLTIPGITLSAENLSISRTGEATGEGKSGNKAKGMVDLINLTENEIILNAGTKITSVSTNKVYVLTENTTVPKGTRNDGIVEAKRLEDVNIEASDFGAEYNIAGSDSNTIFSVEGYSRSSQLQATRYVDFTGGTSQTFVSVSGDNVNKVKEEALPELKEDGIAKLKLEVPTGYRFLEETIEFTETDASANPQIGTPALDGNFNLSLAGSVTAIAVKEDDLEKAITTIIQQDKSRGAEVSVQGVEDLSIDKIEKAEGKIILTVSSKSSLQKNLTIDQIKEDIAGKSISDARDYINLLDEVSKYRIVFNPEFVPDGLRRIPSDLNRITIKTK